MHPQPFSRQPVIAYPTTYVISSLSANEQYSQQLPRGKTNPELADIWFCRIPPLAERYVPKEVPMTLADVRITYRYQPDAGQQNPVGAARFTATETYHSEDHPYPTIAADILAAAVAQHIRSDDPNPWGPNYRPIGIVNLPGFTGYAKPH